MTSSEAIEALSDIIKNKQLDSDVAWQLLEVQDLIKNNWEALKELQRLIGAAKEILS